jgi:GT2 family glycosyltransferase
VISVVVPTMNRPDYLERCVRSLLAGPGTPDEIIVVDQSADDATQRRVASEFDGAPVRWVGQERASASLARNRGVELAGSEYVALIDDDAEVEPGWLQAALAALDELGRPDALYGAILSPEPMDRRDIAVTTHEVASPTVWPRRTHPSKVGFSGHLVVRRSVFLAEGGFDPRLGPGSALVSAEDVDFNYRLLRAGRRVASTPAMRMLHHQWRERDAIPRHMYRYNFGQSAFCAKHLRAGDRGVLRVLVGQAGGDVKMLASAVRRRSWLKARVAAYRGVGTVRGLVAGWRSFPAPRG